MTSACVCCGNTASTHRDGGQLDGKVPADDITHVGIEQERPPRLQTQHIWQGFSFGGKPRDRRRPASRSAQRGARFVTAQVLASRKLVSVKPRRARKRGSRAAGAARAPSLLRRFSPLFRAVRSPPRCVDAEYGCRERGAPRARADGSAAPGMAATQRRRTRPPQVQRLRSMPARSSPCSAPQLLRR